MMNIFLNKIESKAGKVKRELKLHSMCVKMRSTVNLRLALSNELEITMAFKFV